MQKMTPVLLLLLALVSTAGLAQTGEITLSWRSFSSEDFEGALVLPALKDASPEVVKSLVSNRSSDGSAEYSVAQKRWSLRSLRRGLYSFYVSNILRDDDFDNWDSYAWSSDDGLVVSVRIGSSSEQFRPPENRGLVWHVFDVIGETGEILPANRIMPFKRTVYGRILDAVTGKPVASSHATLRSRTDGKIVEDCLAEDGIYVIFASSGAYTLELSASDYIGYSVPVEFIRSEFPLRIDAAMSRYLADKQFRIVLSWSDKPRDLDAHLIGPAGTGEFHISYRNMRQYGERYFLDRDDTDGFGPETITLNRLDAGTYTLCVHDYSNRSQSSGSKLSYSAAVVRVYMERQLMATQSIPAGSPGTAWRAFTLDGRTGAITTLNQFSFQSNPDNVR